MPTGVTNVGALRDSLPTIIDSARIVRPFTGVMPKLVDRQNLPDGTGEAWDEIALSQLTAQDIDEDTKLENYQQLVDTLFSVTPAQVGLAIKITDKAKKRITKSVAAKIGALGQAAMQTKKDKNLLAIGASATTDLGSAGNSMTSALIGIGAARIQGNTTEQGTDMPMHFVGTSFQLKDIQDELVSGIGTYPIPAGLTEQTYRRGFKGAIFDVETWGDNNLTVDASDDAIAMVFGRDGIVHVEGMAPRAVPVRDESYGGGSEILYFYDDYATGIRQQVWIYAVTADSASPS